MRTACALTRTRVVMAAAMFPGCAVDINVDSPEKLRSTRQTAINKRTNLSRALTAFCPDSVTSTALRSEDACVASVDALLPPATANAAKRRACKLAQGDADGAAEVMRSLFTKHQIDLRDADALGLW